MQLNFILMSGAKKVTKQIFSQSMVDGWLENFQNRRLILTKTQQNHQVVVIDVKQQIDKQIRNSKAIYKLTACGGQRKFIAIATTPLKTCGTLSGPSHKQPPLFVTCIKQIPTATVELTTVEAVVISRPSRRNRPLTFDS